MSGTLESSKGTLTSCRTSLLRLRLGFFAPTPGRLSTTWFIGTSKGTRTRSRTLLNFPILRIPILGFWSFERLAPGCRSRKLFGHSFSQDRLELFLFILFSVGMNSLQGRFTKERRTIDRMRPKLPNNMIWHMFRDCREKGIPLCQGHSRDRMGDGSRQPSQLQTHRPTELHGKTIRENHLQPDPRVYRRQQHHQPLATGIPTSQGGKQTYNDYQRIHEEGQGKQTRGECP